MRNDMRDMQRKEDEREMREVLERKLQEKKKQLAHSEEIFKIMVENEIDTGNFERNAISDLMLMFELKTEINELENIILIYNVCHSTEKGGEE